MDAFSRPAGYLRSPGIFPSDPDHCRSIAATVLEFWKSAVRTVATGAYNLSAALLVILFSYRLVVCRDATTPAFTAAQAFYKGAYRRVRAKAEAAKSVSRQPCFMLAMQATDNHYILN
jgi:hypothetical protein